MVVNVATYTNIANIAATMDLTPGSEEMETKDIEVNEHEQEPAENDIEIDAKASSPECDIPATTAESDFVPVIHIPSDSANSDQEPSTGAKKRKPQKTTKLQVGILKA